MRTFLALVLGITLGAAAVWFYRTYRKGFKPASQHNCGQSTAICQDAAMAGKPINLAI
jgi:hypothetical protein